ncbi:hypothetical protein FJY63_10540 [Candidatus Sumerlaeota bacterium]|nr:hypothetical protein [Candidatus Sumerlaeota bacterium]
MALRKREQWLALAALICVGAFAGDRFVASPLASLWKERTKRIAELGQQLSTGSALVEREEAIRNRWDTMKEQALPKDTSVAEKQVLQAMNEWIGTSRLAVSSVRPRWIEEKGQTHKTIECRVVAEGELASVARFMYELERDPMALRLEEVEITSREDRGQKLSLSLRFTGLVLTGE